MTRLGAFREIQWITTSHQIMPVFYYFFRINFLYYKFRFLHDFFYYSCYIYFFLIFAFIFLHVFLFSSFISSEPFSRSRSRSNDVIRLAFEFTSDRFFLFSFFFFFTAAPYWGFLWSLIQRLAQFPVYILHCFSFPIGWISMYLQCCIIYKRVTSNLCHIYFV